MISRKFLWVALSVAAAIHSATLQAEEPKSDKEKITGMWQEVSKTVAGETTIAGDKGGWGLFTYRFENGKVTEWQEGDAQKVAGVEYTLVIDDTKKPKHFDLDKVVNGERYVFPGIYEWDGEKLKVCGAMEAVGPMREGKDLAGNRRPKEFKASGAKSRLHNRLIILEKMPEK